jgi:hypothetical protein
VSAFSSEFFHFPKAVEEFQGRGWRQNRELVDTELYKVPADLPLLPIVEDEVSELTVQLSHNHCIYAAMVV